MLELVAMVMTMAAAAAAAARRFSSFSCSYALPVKHAVAACTLMKKQRGNPLSLVLLQWVRRRGGFPSSDDIVSAAIKTTLVSDQRTQGNKMVRALPILPRIQSLIIRHREF
jgi:hypothetical protein